MIYLNYIRLVRDSQSLDKINQTTAKDIFTLKDLSVEDTTKEKTKQ